MTSLAWRSRENTKVRQSVHEFATDTVCIFRHQQEPRPQEVAFFFGATSDPKSRIIEFEDSGTPLAEIRRGRGAGAHCDSMSCDEYWNRRWKKISEGGDVKNDSVQTVARRERSKSPRTRDCHSELGWLVAAVLACNVCCLNEYGWHHPRRLCCMAHSPVPFTTLIIPLFRKREDCWQVAMALTKKTLESSTLIVRTSLSGCRGRMGFRS